MHRAVFRPEAWISFATVLLLVVMQAGCTFKVKLVGQYDEIVDTSVHQLQADTTAHIAHVLETAQPGASTHNLSRGFISKTQGEIKALIARAEVLEDGLKRTPLTDNLRELAEQYEDYEQLSRLPFNPQVHESAQKAFDQSFRALIKHLVYLKWNQEQPVGDS